MSHKEVSGYAAIKRTTHALFIPGVIVFLVIVAVAASVALQNRKTAVTLASASTSPAASVLLTAAGADVGEVSIQKGQSVNWEVRGSQMHQLALAPSSAEAPGFGTNALIAVGQSYSYAFDRAGTYYYYDVLHPDKVKGAIRVTE